MHVACTLLSLQATTCNQGTRPYQSIATDDALMPQVRKAALDASVAINAKRRNRGLMPRPVRAVMIGFPNVGKSALINRLLNRHALSHFDLCQLILS